MFLGHETYQRLEKHISDLTTHYHALYCPDGKIPDFMRISETNTEQYHEAVRKYSEFRNEINWGQLKHSIKKLGENDVLIDADGFPVLKTDFEPQKNNPPVVQLSGSCSRHFKIHVHRR